MLHEMGSFILKKVNRKCFQYVHKPATDLPPEKPNPPLRTSSYTNSVSKIIASFSVIASTKAVHRPSTKNACGELSCLLI
jgi:hypothetical protein